MEKRRKKNRSKTLGSWNKNDRYEQLNGRTRRKEGRGEGRQRRQEEKKVAHGRGMVHRALPTRPIDSFIDSFTCSFIQYVSNTDYVPDPVRGTRDAAVNKTDRVPVLMEVTDWETDITDIMK